MITNGARIRRNIPYGVDPFLKIRNRLLNEISQRGDGWGMMEKLQDFSAILAI